jgi:hypothetical protein
MMLNRQLPSVLDFPFQDTVRNFVSARVSGGSLAALFDADDYYTSAGTNAYGLTTFLGNHDMGRIGFFLSNVGSADDATLLQRDLLAHDILYLTRGVPVVYYGDEAGMTGSGDGTDKQARQDMFPTKVTEWQGQRRIGGAPIGTGSSLTQSTPIAARMTALAALRTSHPALADGAQITRYGKDQVFAASRIDAASRTEYVVAFNTGSDPASVSFATSTPATTWTGLLGSGAATSAADGTIAITIPARRSVVLKADNPLPTPGAPSVSLRVGKDFATGKYKLTASVPGSDPSSVTFVVRTASNPNWTVLGTDDARPFRVFTRPVRGAAVELAAVVKDSVGQSAASPKTTMLLKAF